MNIVEIITKEQNLKTWQAEAVIKLIDEGNTIPFIARYRKEAHGNMNDEQLRDFDARLKYLRGLQERKESVLSSIQEQGKLTDELRKSIDQAMTLASLEDLYRPYKQKRRTRATIAREKGLEPLAQYILSPKAKTPVAQEAAKYINLENEIPDADTAIHMAQDIIAEDVSDSAPYRQWIREKTSAEGLLVTSKAAKKKSSSGSVSDNAGEKGSAKAGKEVKNEKLAAREDVYEMYYEFSELVSKVPGHRILAINRGEKEGFLTVRIEAPEEQILEYLIRQTGAVRETVSPSVSAGRPSGHGVHSFQDLRRMTQPQSQKQKVPKVIYHFNDVTKPYIEEAVKDSYKRLIAPSIETEIRNDLTAKAEDSAIKVFGANLTQLLMQAPVQGKTVLGWDPAFRTGCKLAVVDPTGKVLDTKVIYPTAPQNKVREAKEELLKLCRKYKVDIISCGNGTASRESEQVIADFIKESGLPIRYVIVSEAGASVYSASKLATEEFPQFDVGQRSAASIARRLQDPLAELVKIDPKAIGVGQYQHDMNQTKLGEALTAVVEDCVNKVGVDANTASAALLSYISGINRTIAKNIVDYREQNGRFLSRRDFLKVPRLGPKAYEQCAGFLRIFGGKEPLDMTGVHPESYDEARTLLKELGFTDEDVRFGKTAQITQKLAEYGKTVKPDSSGRGEKAAQGRGGKLSPEVIARLSHDTGLGEYTLQDVITELEKPGRDPREEVAGPVLRSDVLSIKDLKEGMVLTGTVRNIVDFGAFVDIGVHQDGLVHISQMSDHFIHHPLDVVKVGDIVKVKVLGVDEKKNRISLTMKDV